MKSITKEKNSNYDFSVLRRLRKSHQLTIQELSKDSGISPAVISKLERNQAQPELDTLFHLGKSFEMTATDMLALAEQRTSHTTSATKYRSGDFSFERIEYGNVKVFLGAAKKSGYLSRPEIHKDDYEVCWVVQGKVKITLPDERHVLEAGEALQFDAILPHAYQVLEDCQVIILHLHKEKRF